MLLSLFTLLYSALKKLEAHILGVEAGAGGDWQYRAVCTVAEIFIADHGDIVTLAYTGKDVIYHGRGLKGVMTEDQGFCFLEHAVMLKGCEPL